MYLISENHDSSYIYQEIFIRISLSLSLVVFFILNII